MGRLAVLACAGAALLLAVPATAKIVRHSHHVARHDVSPAYDYRTASSVREEFNDAPRGRWMRSSREEYSSRSEFYERRDSMVVENLRGDFTGGVGYGTDGFVDGYGQMHYFVGSFRRMNPLPHGPHGPNRFAPSRDMRGRGF
jgi:hypothetical protein